MKIIIILTFFIFVNLYSQSKSKYIYVQSYTDKSFKLKDTLQIKLINSRTKEKFKEVEPGMYKVDEFCNLKHLKILVNNKNFKLNLFKFRRNRFFNIKFYEGKIKSSDYLINIHRGDSQYRINKCKLSDCNVFLIQFPQIIISNKKIEVTVNKKFKNYIFDGG